MQVVTRIAPSPTGPLHVGTARTALFNYLFARKHGGTFILRIEDTDQERSREEYVAEIQKGLSWLGLSWDELHRQSERAAVYHDTLQQLIKDDAAYVSREQSKHDPDTDVEVVRLRNPNTTVTFTDVVRGEISFDTTELGDFVIARSVTEPLYHLAVVVDDALMGVTHVIRGEDHISNTSRQILIQKALGFRQPAYAHLPLILGPDRSKLSKRHGATAVREYRDAGILPEALANYLALLGWSPGTNEELFSLIELVDAFDLSQVQHGGAIFDIEKLYWMNRTYIQRIPDREFLQIAEKYLPAFIDDLPQFSPERLRAIVPLIRERIQAFGEITELAEEGEYTYFFARPAGYDVSLTWKADDPAIARTHLREIGNIVEQIPDHNYTAEAIEAAIMPYADEKGRGSVLWPMRVALSDREKSPGPFTIAAILGKKETVERLRAASDTLEA